MYIEVFDRIDASTLTGKLVYPVTDRFIVQWEEMKKVYPKAINLGGFSNDFVTVGTHEQQFNRLIKEVDRLKGEGFIQDDVFIQTGYSNYVPKFCKWEN